MTITTCNAPGLRLVLIRYAQCGRHQVEVEHGVEAAMRAVNYPAYNMLTARGKEQALCLHPTQIERFVHGLGMMRESGSVKIAPHEKWQYMIDGSREAEATALAAGWPTRRTVTMSNSNLFSDLLIYDLLEKAQRKRLIIPVVILASSLTIFEWLISLGVTHQGIDLGLPLCSVSMLDVTGYNQRLKQNDVFVHCLGNTALCRDVYWWCNSTKDVTKEES